MSFLINAIQSYNNVIQSNNAVYSTQSNNQAQIDAIKGLDMNAISKAGPSDSTVQALSMADKKRVLENANNGMKKQFLDAWQDKLDKESKKQIAKDFNIFGDS